MFKGLMRKGLFNRLTTQGGVANPVMARAIVEAVYPSRRSDEMFKPPIVDPRTAALIVEDFLDRSVITYETMILKLWGDGSGPLDFTDYPGHNPDL